MITHLTLKDFAVVSAAELAFGPGMTVVSGETGAGKSLLVDALGFLSGAAASNRHSAARVPNSSSESVYVPLQSRSRPDPNGPAACASTCNDSATPRIAP